MISIALECCTVTMLACLYAVCVCLLHGLVQ